MKRCPACGLHKPPSEFVRNRSSSTGLGSYCKPCQSRISRENRAKNHGSGRQFLLLRRYGIDEATFEWLKLQQRGLCAICRAEPPEHVDHDHATKEVRALLCFTCNGGLGKARDDAALLHRAFAYLTTGPCDPRRGSGGSHGSRRTTRSA